MPKPAIPEEVFKFVPVLYPHLLEILKRSGLSGPTFLALSYIKHFGQPIDGAVACPLSELTEILVNAGLYEKSKNATKLITALEQKAFVRRYRVQQAELQQAFPHARGHGIVVVLKTEGQARLNAVNAEVQKLFERMASPPTRTALTAMFRLFRPIASMLVNRLERIRRANSATEVLRGVARETS